VSAAKHTPGPWVVTEVPYDRDYEGHHEVRWAANGCPLALLSNYAPDERRANARLIAAAPELLADLTKRVKNAEQAAFEDWLARTRPSGDVEQVQSQWDTSSDYEDFCDEWGAALAAIAKATGSAA
jgi:hypothetical protein